MHVSFRHHQSSSATPSPFFQQFRVFSAASIIFPYRVARDACQRFASENEHEGRNAIAHTATAV